MKKIFLHSFVCAALLLLVQVSAFGQQAKYVFYFIGDGMGINQVRATEIFYGKNLSFTQFPFRTFVTTQSASSWVTDSAAGGTALSTGSKTYNGAIGVDADKNAVQNVAEAAKKNGYGVGIITSVGINHATPSAFYGHQKDRNMYDALRSYLDPAKVDYIAGGAILLEKKGHSNDEQEKALAEKGFTLSRDPKTLDAAACKSSLVVLQPDVEKSKLDYDIDRNENSVALKDLVKCGIDYMSANYLKKGFFMMIEGGAIDYACHGNDFGTMVRETRNMDDAMALALEFMEKYPKQTLIVVTADHETGGLLMSTNGYFLDLEPYKYQKCSKDGINDGLAKLREDNPDGVSWEQFKALYREKLGFWDQIKLSIEEEASLMMDYSSAFTKGRHGGPQDRTLYFSYSRCATNAIKMLDKKSHIGWAGGDHSGAPVPLFVKGPCEKYFYNCLDNTDIPKAIKQSMGLK